MITTKEINKILAKNDFKRNKKSFGFDTGLKGLGVGFISKEVKKKLVSNH